MKLTNNTSKLDKAIVLMFFLSGFSALIYQVLWVRLLTKYVGGSAFSISIVLTVFMGGMALGSIIAARFVDRIRETNGLILLYGLMQAVIGACGILIPVLIIFFKPLYQMLYSAFYEQFLVYNVLASLFSVVILLVPTSLMGATLPALSRYYLRTFPKMGTRIGKLYGINTLAAALGALICGLWMVYKFGVYGSLGIAVAINLSIAMACFVLVGRGVRWKSLLSLVSVPLKQADGKSTNVKGVLLILAVSGFCGMGYEVVWTRLIALLVGPTTYSFSIVLFTFITGLALGSMLFGKLCDKTRRPFALLIFTQLGACLLGLATSHILGSSQVFFSKLLYEFKDQFFMLEFRKSLALFAFMLPPTLLFGAAFPIATKVHTINLKTVGKSVGSLYAANTVGALFGSFLTGFALIPFLGKTNSISLLVIGQAFTAIVVLSFYSLRSKNGGAANSIGMASGKRLLAPVLSMGIVIIILAFPFPNWNTASLASALYQRFDRIKPALECMNSMSALLNPARHNDIVPSDNNEIVYINDGIGGFIAVGQSINELGASNVFLSISGKTDASTRHDMSTMTLSGQIPMLFHPDPQDALVVGLASGITAGEMLHYPISQLDVLEISPEVVDACSFFAPWNNNVLSDPRAKIITQDARTHLALSERKYDVIMSEPSNPWMAGVASLFTLEYFQDVKASMKPGGIFVQWFQTYQTDWPAFSMMGATLSKVFPNMILMRSDTEGADFLFVCFKDDQAALSLETASKQMEYARLSTNMEMTRPELLFPLVLSTKPTELFADQPLTHTENRPYLEYLAPRSLYSGGRDIIDTVMKQKEISPAIHKGLNAFSNLSVRVEFAAFMASMNVMPFNLVNQTNMPPTIEARLDRIHGDYSRNNMVADYSAIVIPEYKNQCLSIHEAVLNRRKQKLSSGSAANHVLARICFALGDVHRASNDYRRAALSYAEAVGYMPDFRLALRNLAASYERIGQYGKAIETLDRLLGQTPKSHTLLTRKASNQLKLDMKEAALHSLDQALKYKPDYVPALVAASGIHGMLGNYEKSIEYGFTALDEDPKQIRAYRNLIAALLRIDQFGEAARVAQQGLQWFPNDQMLQNVLIQTRQHIEE